MILLVVLASILIAAVTVYQYKEQSQDYHRMRLERKESQLISSINYVLKASSWEIKTENLAGLKNKNNNLTNQDALKKASLRLMLTKEEIIELSLLNLILNYPDYSENKIEELSTIDFSFKDNENFLSELISSLTNQNVRPKDNLLKKLEINFDPLLKKINMYANNKSIINNLDQNSFSSFFEDYLAELHLFKKNKELSNLESELVKNPSQDMYDRYISLKNS